MANSQITSVLSALIEKQDNDKAQSEKYKSLADALDKECRERAKLIKLLQAASKDDNINMTLAEIMDK